MALSGVDSDTNAPPPATATLSTFSVADRLAAVVTAADEHTRALVGGSTRGSIIDAFSQAEAGHDSWVDLVHGARRLRANLTLRSVYVRDALRLGVGLALAVAVANELSLQHGFWVAFAALTVIKSNVRATGRSVGDAIAGTVAGFVAATIVISIFGTNTGAYALLLPVAVAVAIYANTAISFRAGQAGFTVTIVVLFNLLGPAGWRIGLVRIEDVVAGGIAGLLIGALAWPRGATAAIGPATADLFDTASEYLVASVRGWMGELPTATTADRRIAIDAAVRAENSFAQYLTEHPAPEQLSQWARLLAAGNRLWYAADLIASAPVSHSVNAIDTAASASHMRDRSRSLASSLRKRGPSGRTDDFLGFRDAHSRSSLSAWLEDLALEPPSTSSGSGA